MGETLRDRVEAERLVAPEGFEAPFVTTDARIHRSGQGRCKIEMFCEQTIGT